MAGKVIVWFDRSTREYVARCPDCPHKERHRFQGRAILGMEKHGEVRHGWRDLSMW